MRQIIVVLVLVAFSSSADARTVMECGPIIGKSLIPDGSKYGLDGDNSWVDDGIKNGSIALTISEDGAADILVRDSIGLMSVKSEGGEVIVLDAKKSTVEILVSYSGGAKEIITFDVDRKKVYWSQHKFGVTIDKVALFTAQCR